ncbi:MAG: family 20 glycosylhydrolase [Bacteroidales bacterium]|nr:family 20 glycosylhydrolase [Bacteroidales bacterium]
MKLMFSLLVAAAINVIPKPASVQVGDGFFDLTKSGGRMEFTVNPASGIAPEGYTLSVSDKGVKAVASDEAGLFYARQTLGQLIQPGGKIPFVEIQDAPRFAWRGFHVDPCRHFMSIEDVKKQIDIMSRYKVNVMHWHLTDDQGWRIEIKKYPRLQEISAWRTEFDGTVYGGYYTQEEIKEVVAYAAERFVTVVPEIEMPGHAISAIRAYPWLSCTGEEVKTFYTWGTPNISLCPGKESTFEFLEDVIKEVVELFPSQYIHIGGDECRKDRWEKCPLCQQRIENETIVADDRGTAVEKLQSYAVHRMEGILAKYGRKLIGWDEILEGGLSPQATVMSWRGESGGKKAAAAGHDVIMTPSSEGMYFDAFQGDSKIEPSTIGNYTTLEKVYNYDPVPAELKAAGKAHHVIGVQCNNWSEYMYEPWQRYYMLFPRAFALAEIAWSSPDGKDFSDFCRRVDAACQTLDEMGIPYHIPLPEQPGGSCNNLVFIDKCVVPFCTTRLEEMVWTLDGSDPTPRSRRYMWPMEFTEDATLKIATLTAYGKLSPIRTINIRKMAPLPASEPEPMKVRRADGRFLSSADFGDAEWKEIQVERLRDIVSLEPYDRNLPDSTRFFAAWAEGSFKVSDTAVYRFSSDCDEVWIDDIKLIDNSSAPVKRYSSQDAELALEKGWHSFRMLYIFNIKGGWNPLRNKSDISIRKAGDSEWKNIKVYHL